MSRNLSYPACEVGSQYDVIVIGSGYGGGVAALRFAEAGARVGVLERGREWRAADFPRDAAALTSSVRVRYASGERRVRVGAASRLYELHVFEGLTAIVGSGLGGTSLINANAFVEPARAVLDDPRWPRALRDDARGLGRGLARAREVLAPAPWRGPAHKAEALRRAGSALGAVPRRLDLLVEQDGAQACTGCGDCVTGCPTASKRTVDRTYLRAAADLGAELFTEVEARLIEQTSNGLWAVRFRPVVPPLRDDTPLSFLLAERVVVAAGTFGSTELLLRSRNAGLAISPAVGSQVSTNANAIGLVLDAAPESDDLGTPGPCIVSDIVDPETGTRVEDGSVPRPLDPIVAMLADRHGSKPSGATGLLGRLAGRARDMVALGVEAWAGARQGAVVLLAQARDRATGMLDLDPSGEHLTLVAGDEDGAAHARRALERVAGAWGAKPIDPGDLLPAARSVTVHPLGGCPMGDDRDVGVVDHLGRVFDPRSIDPTATHAGLVVLDASVIPTALGANPVATICALAERACEALVQQERGQAPEPLRAPRRTATEGHAASFSEAFSGWLAPSDLPAFGLDEHGAPREMSAQARLDLVVQIQDVDAFLSDPLHLAGASGSLRCEHLAARPLMISRGDVHLFADDPAELGKYYLTYDLPLLTDDGRRGRLRAMKTFTDGSAAQVYRDGTSLPITIDGFGPTWRGLLTIQPVDILTTIAKVRAHGGGSLRARVAAQARFEAFFVRRWMHRWQPEGARG